MVAFWRPRQALLDDDFIHELNMEEYALNAYEQTIRETPVLPDDSRRKTSAWDRLPEYPLVYGNSSWSDGPRRYVQRTWSPRTVADYRIVEYIFNIPWDIKCPDGIMEYFPAMPERASCQKELVETQSPYPKTYDLFIMSISTADQLKSPRFPQCSYTNISW